MFCGAAGTGCRVGHVQVVTLAGPLAGLSWLVNVGLLVLSWYLADRITYDCTLLEEDRESLQGGLLQTLGESVATSPATDSKETSRSSVTNRWLPIRPATRKN